MLLLPQLTGRNRMYEYLYIKYTHTIYIYIIYIYYIYYVYYINNIHNIYIYIYIYIVAYNV